jgi:hypothetical protein
MMRRPHAAREATTLTNAATVVMVEAAAVATTATRAAYENTALTEAVTVAVVKAAAVAATHTA